MFPKKNAKLPTLKKVSSKKKKSIATTRALMAPSINKAMKAAC